MFREGITLGRVYDSGGHVVLRGVWLRGGYVTLRRVCDFGEGV